MKLQNKEGVVINASKPQLEALLAAGWERIVPKVVNAEVPEDVETAEVEETADVEETSSSSESSARKTIPKKRKPIAKKE